MAEIHFGTSGWRGVIADDFTFENVKVVTQAIADHIVESGLKSKGILIGYDPRFLSDRFAEAAASVLAGNGIQILLSDRDIPTPALSYEILQCAAAGAINFTASHNPSQYNGLKFSPAWGGPALPETTKRIEALARAGMVGKRFAFLPFEEGRKQGLIRFFDGRKAYLKRIRELVDFEVIRSSGLKVAVDPMFGTSRGYLDRLLEETGLKVRLLHNRRDPYFGGKPPEPSEEHIHEMIAAVREEGLDLGLGTDGDADRFGIVDRGGKYIEANMIIALLLDYLIRTRGWEGGVARSVASSHLIDRVAELHGRKVYETPVGFKYIGDLIAHGKVVIGGEESSGLTIRGHVPEKDGILAGLLVAEMVAREGKSVGELLAAIYEKVGTVLTRRVNLKLTPSVKENLAVKMSDPPVSFAGRKVAQVVTIDGMKLILDDGSWVLMRLSGTEPVARFYIDAASEATLDALTSAGRDFILN
ncbi:MAG: phosphoglucomutase/phosphomannomutase family protein [Deltaproteobacteria bacterium]|nr:phosphoglucomutase/phosphomannomutase family protein [Deltaproteobacteria bacterium]